MHAKRVGVLSGTVMAYCVLAGLAAVPVAGADGCTLTAPAALHVGDPLTVLGSGFPANSSVIVTQALEGGASDEFSVESDASGGFQINQTPEVVDIGTTTLTATGGATCTASTVFVIVGAGATLPPEPPSGASGGADAGGNPPTTDAAGPTRGASTAWAIAAACFLLGVVGTLATRRGNAARAASRGSRSP